MISKTLSLVAALCCLVLLVACVNLKPVPSQTKSYTLGPVEVEAPAQQEAASEPIYIIRPQVPTYLDGSRLSYRLSSGEVKNIAGTRWAEPLAEGIARAMSLYLSSSAAVSVEGYYPWPNASAKASRLSLNFQRFGATDSGNVQVVVGWILQTSEKNVIKGQFTSGSMTWDVEEPDTLIAAYNKALEALAREIESGLAK